MWWKLPLAIVCTLILLGIFVISASGSQDMGELKTEVPEFTRYVEVTDPVQEYVDENDLELIPRNYVNVSARVIQVN